VLTRWYDFELASGLTLMFDHSHDVKSATEPTRVLTRWSLARQQVGAAWTALLTCRLLCLLSLIAGLTKSRRRGGWQCSPAGVTLTWRCGSRWCSLTDVTASRRRS
jgi:hypothetical protein